MSIIQTHGVIAVFPVVSPSSLVQWRMEVMTIPGRAHLGLLYETLSFF